MRENFPHWVVTFLIFLYVVELLVCHKHLWCFSPLFFFSYLNFILLVCASMHACMYVCVGGYEHVLSLRSQMTTFGVVFAFYQWSLLWFLLCCILQASWPVSFWMILPSLPLILYKSPGITDMFYLIQLSSWVLGIELSVWDLYSKYFYPLNQIPSLF